MKFIEEIAQSILSENSIPLEQIMVVLPNKRAKRFLLNALMDHLEQPTFAPEIVSINEFIERLSPYKLVDNQKLLLDLYEIYAKEMQCDDFMKFLGWSSLFLSDINEVDIQMIDPAAIFTNLADIKELETSFLAENLTKNQQEYLLFYEKLYHFYEVLNERMKEQSLAYQGMLYRNVAENVANYATKLSYKRYIFAGFHALSPSELTIVDYFYQNMPHVEVLFDIDKFYEKQYAPFAKRIADQLGISSYKPKTDFCSISKDIKIMGAVGVHSQIYHAIDVLENIKKEQGDLNDTVLVLADETLLLPFVHAYGVENVNFTMGYPMKASRSYELLSQLFTIGLNYFRFQDSQNINSRRFYAKDLLAFLNNPLITKTYKNCAQKRKEILDQNMLFVSEDFIDDVVKLPDFLEEDTLIDQFVELLSVWQQNVDADSVDVMVLDKMMQILHEVKSLLEDFKIYSESFPKGLKYLQTLEYLVTDRMNKETIPFVGDFDKGLQVMGLLETRTLDFKNVIILSVNETVLPKGRDNSTFFMYDLKRHFNLPTYHEKDAIFAYHFFRLLQRASHIHIVYDTDSSTSLVEKSRFITQLIFEVKRQEIPEDIVKIVCGNVNILPQIQQEFLCIAKDAEMLNRLEDMRFSPSSLAAYINCPLQFYFRYIAKLTPTKTSEDLEDIGNNIVGTIVHYVLEKIFEKAVVNPSYKLESILSEGVDELDELIDDAIKKEQDLYGMDFSSGKPYLMRFIIRQYLQRYLEVEKASYAQSPYSIESVEEELSYTMVGDRNIKLYGKADRIDNRSGEIWILDYKTGKVDEKKLQIKEEKGVEFKDTLKEKFSDKDYKQLFQLCFYTYLYKKNNPNNNVRSGIIALRETNKKSSKYIFTEELPLGFQLDDFESVLQTFFDEIFDQSRPFVASSSSDSCSYCDYKDICRR